MRVPVARERLAAAASARATGGRALELPGEAAAPAGWSRRFDGPLDLVTEVARVVRGLPALIGAYRGGVPPERREAVMVAVSQANACRACNTVHRWWALRAGVSREDLDAIATGDLSGLDTSTEVAVAHATARVIERFTGPASHEVATAQLGARQVKQIEAIARVMSLANLSLNTLRDGWSRGGG